MSIERFSQPDKRKAHVFVVDRYSFPVHRSRGFCGVKDPRRLWGISGRASLYADLRGTRLGDLVFFYQRRIDEPSEERGFRGIYEIASEPFIDTSDVEWSSHRVLGKCPGCGSTFPEDSGNAQCRDCGQALRFGEHILPNRVLIKPVAHFKKSLEDNMAYVDRTDPGTLWTLLFRKVWGPGRARSVCPILPEETEKLIRLLRRVNEDARSDIPSPEPYPSTQRKAIRVDLGRGLKVRYEHILAAWFMKNLDKDVPVLGEVIGSKEELEWFGNEIIYGIGGAKVDVLCLHKRDGVRYKATVFELKDGDVEEGDVDQIKRYSYWVSQLATANAKPRVKSLLLQPVLVGHYVSGNVLSLIKKVRTRKIEIPYPWGDCVVTIQPPISLTYGVSDGEMEFEYAIPPQS